MINKQNPLFYPVNLIDIASSNFFLNSSEHNNKHNSKHNKQPRISCLRINIGQYGPYGKRQKISDRFPSHMREKTPSVTRNITSFSFSSCFTHSVTRYCLKITQTLLSFWAGILTRNRQGPGLLSACHRFPFLLQLSSDFP